MLTGCSKRPQHFETEVLNGFTPVKNQGSSQLCWAYAMLAAIETEHIERGDSVHLSVAFIDKVIEQLPEAPSSKRAMGITTLNLMQEYGMVPYDAMPTADMPLPRHAYMMGMEYSPQEFARSVCAPGEYIALGTNDEEPFYNEYEPAVPDNWEHNRLYNLPPDSLLAITEQAVRSHHGVCWEGDTSEHGFNWAEGVADTWLWNGSTSDNHCMAIVGIAHDEDGQQYFIMKNSWGTDNAYSGLMYLSFNYFRIKTIAIYLPKAVMTSGE